MGKAEPGTMEKESGCCLKEEIKMYNVVRLLEGHDKLTKREYSHFSKGDTIWGADSNAKELKK